jgi:hypothetical protein
MMSSQVPNAGPEMSRFSSILISMTSWRGGREFPPPRPASFQALSRRGLQLGHSHRSKFSSAYDLETQVDSTPED